VIRLNFKGKLVSCNRRLIPGKGRLVPSKAYKECKEVVVWCFKSQYAGKPLSNPDILLFYKIGKKADYHNYAKLVLDAMQEAGILKDDKDIGWLNQAPPELHKDGEQDEVVVIITGGKDEEGHDRIKNSN